MGLHIDVLLVGGALAALACVMILLAVRPGRKHRVEMLTLLSRAPRNESAQTLAGSRTSAKFAPDHSVFISYRRMDSADIVGRLYEHLTSVLGPDAVFKDVDSIDLGHDFRAQLDISLNACRVLLCVMGDQWAGPAGLADRLIDHSEDFVRIEIETALRREIPIIPILVRGMRMPQQDFFPASLKNLAFRQGLPLRPDPDFRNDVRKLLASVEPKVHAQ